MGSFPDRYTKGTLVERLDFSEDLALFRLQPEEPLTFAPGQYATLALQEPDGQPVLRPYSVASAPHEKVLDFFVELVDVGVLTPLMWEMRAGDEMWVRKKLVGRFLLDEREPPQHHVMAATVTGIAPYVSMARAQIQALQQDGAASTHQFTIIHGASRSWEFGSYLNELREYDEQHEWLTYIPTVSRPWEDVEWNGELGRVEDVLRKHMDAAGCRPDNAIAYACGHPSMIENVKNIVRRAHFEDDRFKEEKYFPASSAQ